MRLTLRTLAALLGYPSQDLKAAIPEIREALSSERALPRAARRRLDPLLDRLERDDLLDSQSAYSELFDRSRSLSLHLFEHVHGDNKERGQALIDLGQQYLEKGFFLDGPELPDFIPVFAEFASCLPPEEARDWLGQPLHVFAALEERLTERGSDYAAVLGGLVALAQAKPDQDALGELRERAPSDDPARIDEEWEEKAVTFMASHEMGGPTGIVARLRAAGKAMVAARNGTKG
ncbi:Respiratory nitrate reductase delta chain [Rubellimicrobium mesophilum DSM 19309]|uniref:Respiratory nitrate reductase delta chain n=1 Tax=Rubellimicrobium mesophilum DSM 19309 TaxID=442562 RepID=A0A017HEY7_9RHOB|nr:nitrate reductase molybdenum cofactor assembly chaperone [Rubellimicrobium mesophilum]EYD72880.1 Respiratory nitrate reductase delta chain [Rubellimicrobium mesophilum DSM 19309]